MGMMIKKTGEKTKNLKEVYIHASPTSKFLLYFK
jgi:hypothetical protein